MTNYIYMYSLYFLVFGDDLAHSEILNFTRFTDEAYLTKLAILAQKTWPFSCL